MPPMQSSDSAIKRRQAREDAAKTALAQTAIYPESVTVMAQPPKKEELVLTPASEFRAVQREGILKELPSGKVVRMRNVSMTNLLLKGRFSDLLTPLVHEMLRGVTQEELKVHDTERVLEASTALRQEVCKEALVYPRIVESEAEIADDAILISDLSDTDQAFILELLYGPVERMRSFR